MFRKPLFFFYDQFFIIISLFFTGALVARTVRCTSAGTAGTTIHKSRFFRTTATSTTIHTANSIFTASTTAASWPPPPPNVPSRALTMAADHYNGREHRRKRFRGRMVALIVAYALCAVAGTPAAALSPATGDMSLLTMQRIKSYVDDTCTLDPHCQWTWNEHMENGLRNVSVKEAEAMVPEDYLYPPGSDTEASAQRGECRRFWSLLVLLATRKITLLSRFLLDIVVRN